jgi:hypothetical protein
MAEENESPNERPPLFVEPTTRQEAEKRIVTLNGEKASIEGQLSNMGKRHPDGQMMTGVEYHQWRHRAICAVKWKTSEALFLKRWLAAHPPASEGVGGSLKRPMGNIMKTLGRQVAAMEKIRLAAMELLEGLPADQTEEVELLTDNLAAALDAFEQTTAEDS